MVSAAHSCSNYIPYEKRFGVSGGCYGGLETIILHTFSEIYINYLPHAKAFMFR